MIFYRHMSHGNHMHDNILSILGYVGLICKCKAKQEDSMQIKSLLLRLSRQTLN